MVTLNDGQPVAKVIDFGIAKATEQKLTERTLFTAYGEMIGTPAYMSPEQAEMSSVDVDTRSDIYSLGVLLYELMTGTTPIDDARLRTAGFSEIQRLIREVTPPRPSSRLSTLGESATVMAGNRGTDPKRLTRLLAGDLDWIMMKALEKDRNRRYATAGDFAADIERFLRHEAVLARPPSAAYRLATFVRRHRGGVVAAAAVAAATLLAGTAVATWQAVVATRAKHARRPRLKWRPRRSKPPWRRRRRRRRCSVSFKTSIFAAARPKGRPADSVQGRDAAEAIDAAVPFVDKSFEDQPLAEARLRMTLGDSFWFLGDGEGGGSAIRAGAGHLRRGSSARNIPTRSIPSSARDQLWDARAHRESVELYQEILPICKGKLGPDTRQTLQSMNNLGMGCTSWTKYEDAIGFTRKLSRSRRTSMGPTTAARLST